MRSSPALPSAAPALAVDSTNEVVLPVTDRQRRAAMVADVLARAVRAGDAEAVDVLRILRHELRCLNTGKKLAIAVRSIAAQRVIDDCAERGKPPPNNNSLDALHADHVWRLSADHLQTTDTVEKWVEVLQQLATVVCVTARENYELIKAERTTDGPKKYSIAGVQLATSDLPWT